MNIDVCMDIVYEGALKCTLRGILLIPSKSSPLKNVQIFQ